MKTRDMGKVMAVLLPDPAETKILVARDAMHPLAAVRLLEGLALWFQRTVRVVPCVDGRCDGCSLSLVDAFGVGTTRLHDEVEIVALRSEHRRAIWRGGQGDFGDLRVAMGRARRAR